MIYQFTAHCTSQKVIVPLLKRLQEVLTQLTMAMGDHPPVVFFPIEDLSRHIIMEVTFDNNRLPPVLRLTVHDDANGIATLEQNDEVHGWIRITNWKCLV